MRNRVGAVAGAGLAGILLAAAGCGRSVSSGVSIDPAFRPFLSPDTKALADIDLDKLKKSPLYTRHAKELVIPEVNGTSVDMGFDPQRDASNILVEWNGKAATILVRGQFDATRVEKKLASLGMKSTRYQKYNVWGDEHTSVVFINKGLGLTGPAAEVHRAIDLEQAGKGAAPEELVQRMNRVPKGDAVWLVSRGGLPFAEVQLKSEIESALSNIIDFVNGVTAGIGVDSGLNADIAITCTSEQGARRVHDALRGGIGIARLSTKDNQADLLRIYDAINVDQDKALVRIKANYPAELSDWLLDFWKRK